jgi:serine/threonine protein kinase
MCVVYSHAELIFELFARDLRQHLRRFGALRGLPLKNAVYDCVCGVAYCHSQRVFHRDLKPANILVDSPQYGTGLKLTIADFGLARQFSCQLKPATREVITLWYRPPEIILGQVAYGPAVDVFSLGCIFHEMATCRPLLPSDSEVDHLFRTFRLLGTPTDATWPGFTSLPDYNPRFPKWQGTGFAKWCENGNEYLDLDFMGKLLQNDPAKRSSSNRLRSHSFFREIKQYPEICAVAQSVVASPGGVSPCLTWALSRQNLCSRTQQGGSWLAVVVHVTILGFLGF